MKKLKISFFRVAILESHYNAELEKKSRRRKRKARSGKKKQKIDISGQPMQEKRVPPMRSFTRRH